MIRYFLRAGSTSMRIVILPLSASTAKAGAMQQRFGKYFATPSRPPASRTAIHILSRKLWLGSVSKSAGVPRNTKRFHKTSGTKDVLTTFTSYGAVPLDQQASIIRSLGSRNAEAADSTELANEIIDLISRRKRA
jgi:hypothetical protein